MHCVSCKNIIKRKEGDRKMEIYTFEQIKDEVYGRRGTSERDRLERELEALHVGFQIRAARERQKLTQEELARRIGKKRSFVSRMENDGENMTLRTLYEIVERGLGGKLKIEVQI